MSSNRTRTRTAEPSYKFGRDIQPSYFYSRSFITSFITDVNALIEMYSEEMSRGYMSSGSDLFDVFIRCYTRLGWRNVHFLYLHPHTRCGFYDALFRVLLQLFKERTSDTDAISVIIMFLYVVWSTQPDDKHLYRVVHIPIEIDTLQQLHAATQHSDFLSWIVSQLSFTIHPQQTLLPRQIPATTVAKHIPSQDRAEVVVEHLIKAKERLRLMEKRMSLIKEGRVGEVMLGEHLLDLEDDEEDVELPDIDVASNAGIEQLKGEVTATLNQLERLSTEAHTLAIEVMKTYE